MSQLPQQPPQAPPVQPEHTKGCFICDRTIMQSVGKNHQHIEAMVNQANQPWGIVLWGADGWGDVMGKPKVIMCSECVSKLRKMVLAWNDGKKELDKPQ